MISKTMNKFLLEIQARAVWMVLDNEGEHASRWAEVCSIAAKISCTGQTLNNWLKKAEIDSGARAGVLTELADRLNALERQNRGLRQANEILRRAGAYFAQAELDRRCKPKGYGVEPICKVLPIATSTYHAHVAGRRDPALLSERAQRGAVLKNEICRVFKDNYAVDGVRKVWRQMKREGYDVACCPVARLMKAQGLESVIRGKSVRTTVTDKAAPCPLDLVNRQFRAPRPNVLWLSDFTYVATCQGFVYVAFVICAYARGIVGWRASRSAHAGFVLDAKEQALHYQKPVQRGGLVHHSDRAVQYVSIKYTERLAEAGIEPLVGSYGDSYDNALAETINSLYKTEVIYQRRPRRSFEAVEFASLEWVDWFNNRRLLEPIANIPPAEAEGRHCVIMPQSAMAA